MKRTYKSSLKMRRLCHLDR